MKRYLVWLGTRPEAIKMCPLILCLQGQDNTCVRVVLSGQHRDMVRPVLDFFGVRADADLGVMREGQDVQSLSERLLASMANEMKTSGFVPDACLVHGDTTTAMIGALCSFYAGVPVCHVEAGLRTGDVYAPFPEEFNRRAIDAMSYLHFAPTAEASRRLVAEGACRQRIFTVGNTATDALRLCLEAECSHPLLDAIASRRLVLLTCHRRELGERERQALFAAIREQIEQREDVVLIFPVHPSPTVRAAAERAFCGCRNAILTEPLDLPVLQHLLSRATLLLTDSGGLQEEATYLGVPTLVLREQTERPEGVSAGVLCMAGTHPKRVGALLATLLEDGSRLCHMKRASDVYGNGHVAEGIVRLLERWT